MMYNNDYSDVDVDDSIGFLRSDVVYIAGLKDLLNCKLDYFG